MTQQVGQLDSPKPFVKWAGGKRQLISVINANIPLSFGTYFEPFLGGGAVLFHLLSARQSVACRVSDLNPDLVLAYVAIRDRVNAVVSSLKRHAKGYMSDPRAYYYGVRSSVPDGGVEKASRLIFLNRTCFNGLYRVNSRGMFNVPLGKYVNPNIVNEENLRAVSRSLQSERVQISCGDFEIACSSMRRGDFVYFDPPYQPVSRTASFTGYTRQDFGATDLKRLVDLCHALDSRGCHVLLSNSNLQEIADHFDEDWEVTTVSANRCINSSGAGRAGHTELMIRNY